MSPAGGARSAAPFASSRVEARPEASRKESPSPVAWLHAGHTAPARSPPAADVTGRLAQEATSAQPSLQCVSKKDEHSVTDPVRPGFDGGLAGVLGASFQAAVSCPPLGRPSLARDPPPQVLPRGALVRVFLPNTSECWL